MAESFQLSDRRRIYELVAVIGLIASSLLLTPRLDLAGFEQLFLGGISAALFVSLPVPGTAGKTMRSTVATLLVAACALLVLFADRIELDVTLIHSAALLALLAAVLIDWDEDAFAGLIPGSALALPILLFAAWLQDTAVVPASTSFLASALVVVCTGRLLVCGDQGDLAEIPASLCVAGAAIALVATTVSNDGIWLTIALLLIGAATLLESTSSWQMSRFHDGSVSSAVVLIAMGSGAAAIALAVVTGAPFGWPIAGALSAGIVGGCAIAHESQLANRATSALLRQAQRESRVDPLTGVLNRRGIEERIDWELARSIRYRHAMSLLLIDLDDFKAINDRFGHAQGDEALRQVAQTIDASIRSIDAAGRFGGEEFLVLLPETDVHGALVVAERIRASVEEMGLATISIGVAERGSDLSERAQLVAAADEALYRAKRAGKNRAELAG